MDDFLKKQARSTMLLLHSVGTLFGCKAALGIRNKAYERPNHASRNQYLEARRAARAGHLPRRGPTPERVSHDQFVLTERFCEALERLNPHLAHEKAVEVAA